MKRLLLALPMLLCAAAVSATGCTKAEPPRSFVQPNALRKADYVGTWYYNATVIDAPPTNGVMYEGEYGELSKIKWVISEDTLFAVRAYPFVYDQEDAETPGSVHGNVDGSDTYEGEPLAAWRITSHFDIIRDYNPSTGEETNRIIESQERPWNEREYMRVDWSLNLAPDYTGIGLFWAFDGVNITDLSYYVSDPTSPDAMHVERADSNDSDLGFAQGEMNYFDITAQLITGPNEQEFVIDDQGDQQLLPSCFLYYGSEDCAAQKVKLRHSFSKLPPNSTYEKRKWDGVDQDAFGFFTTELRHFWDRQYGDTYTGDKRYVERFNLFAQSCNKLGSTCEAPHRVRDPNDATWLTKYTDADLADAGLITTVATGRHLSETEAETTTWTDGGPIIVTVLPDGGPVAVADDQFYYEGTDDVPLTRNADGTFTGDDNWMAYSQRTQRTIPYYCNTEMPENIWQDSSEVIREWNNVFKVSYQDLTGKAATQDIFVWCHNPVKQTADSVGPADPAACLTHLKADVDVNGNVVNGADGKPVYEVRQGDPRYSSILWLGQYQAGGPLGLGPAMADPETGETVSAKANIYGGALETYAAYARDLLELENQQISPEQYIVGTNVDAWVKQQQNQGNGIGTAAPRVRSQNELQLEANRMNFSWAKGANPGPVDHTNLKTFLASLNTREQNMQSVFGDGSGDLQQAKVDLLRNTPIETQLATPELTNQMGLDSRVDFSSLTPTQKYEYTPINSPRLHLVRQQYVEEMEAFGFDFEPFNYDVIKGEAQRYISQTPDFVYNDLLKRIFIAVTLHEVGHNMGLRHNFRATFDAMNYFPGYWTQRQAAAQGLGNPQTPNGDAKLFARSNPKGAEQTNELAPQTLDLTVGPSAVTGFDPGTVSSLGQQYSSIMDYGAAFNTDTVGLGHYDIAAIKYGYANYVEVFTDVAPDSSGQGLFRLASLQVFQDQYGFPSPLLNTTDGTFQAVNYYSYPEVMAHGQASLQKRSDVPAYSIDDRTFNIANAFGPPSQETVRAALVGGQLLPQVPYYFCSDEFVGNLSCQRFDFGADAYEQAEDIINRYWNYYILRNFKRDQYSFHNFGLSGHYVDYTLERYFEIIREQMTWYVLLRSDFTTQENINNQPLTQLNSFLSDDTAGWGSFTAAINDGFKLFGDVLTAPQAGAFLPAPDLAGDTILTQINDSPDTNPSDIANFHVRNLDVTDGRYETTSWNFTGCGYYWGDECQTRIGYFVDKWLALYALSESQAYFTGRDTSVDVRQYAIGYWLPYKQQILSTYGAIFSGNNLALAPYDLGNNEGLARLDMTSGQFLDPNGQPVTNTAGMDQFDPEVGFSVQMWAGVWGISGFSSTLDQAFIDSTRVFVVGNGEAPVPDASLMLPDGTPGPLATNDPTQIAGNGGTLAWLIYTDPISQKTYAAHSIAPSTVGCTSTTLPLPGDPSCTTKLRADIAAQMLEHASKLYARTSDPTVDKDIANNNYLKFQENLDMMRSLHNAMGAGYYFLDQ